MRGCYPHRIHRSFTIKRTKRTASTWPQPDKEPPNFIWPHEISRALYKVKYGYDGIVTAGMVNAIDQAFGGPPALTPEKATLHDRLAARLALSEAHVSERERVSDEIGLTAIYKKMGKVADQWGSIEIWIEAARPKSISDLRLKLELYDNNPSDEFAQYLLRDMRKAFVTVA